MRPSAHQTRAGQHRAPKRAGKTDPMTNTIQMISSVVADAAKVRLGAMSPALPTADAGRVKLGAMSPALPVADAGRVKLGAMSPALPVADAGRVKLGAMSPAL